MILTICLVTKGRKQYLNEALSSYEEFLNTGEVNVIIIDNGSDSLSKEILYNWKLKHDSKVSYFRVESNEKLGTPFFWEKISSFNPNWIIFPGDDDVLVFDIYEEWKKALKNNGSLNAFAASAQVIDSKSKLTGEIRMPAVYGVLSRVEMVSRSLHEPPFFWPCLFIRFDVIPEKVITSRFVFDWWISLQIVLKDQVESTKSIGLKYRTHQNQESVQATSRRKNFEGYGMLSSVINSAPFNEYLGSMTDSDLKALVGLCMSKKPLYGQPEYYNGLIKDLTFNIIDALKDNLIRNEIAEKYILSSNVYTKNNDLETIYTGLDLASKESKGNLTLNFSEGICENLGNVEKLFNQNSSAKIDVSCKHSKFTQDSVIVNCINFNGLDDYEIADMVLLAIEDHFQNKGLLNYTITPFERELIKFYRRLKLKIPRLIKKNLSQIKRYIGNKNAI